MNINDIIECNIVDVASSGDGIAKSEGFIIFVPSTVDGDIVKVKINHIKKNLAYGRVISLIKPSVYRREEACSVCRKCGGCNLQHISYDRQLSIKKHCLRNTLRKNADIVDPIINEVISVGDEFGYRNKLQLPVREINGKVEMGFFKSMTHEIVPIDECMLHGEWATKLISIMRKYMNDYNVSAYNEERGDGMIRHIVARNIDGKLSIVIVINGKVLNRTQALIDMLKSEFGDFSLGINTNTRRDNLIMEKNYRCLYGNETLSGAIAGLKFELSPLSFLQVNTQVATRIYEDVNKLIDKDEVVVDCYSGVGIMSALVAKKAKKVYGIELVYDASYNAHKLNKLNNINNVVTIYGDVAEKLPPLVDELKAAHESKVTVIIDPPRKGCDESVLNTIRYAAPERIIYISCNPASLARDLAVLTGKKRYDGTPITSIEQDEAYLSGKSNNLCSENVVNEQSFIESNKDTVFTTKYDSTDGIEKKVFINDGEKSSLNKEFINDDTITSCSNFNSTSSQFATDTNFTYLDANNTHINNTNFNIASNIINVAPSFYEIVSITPYDMFPNTAHVETLVSLVKKS